MAVTAADQAQFEAEYLKFLEQEQAAVARRLPNDAKAAAHEFVSALRDTGLRELTEFKEKLQDEARQAAVNVLAESGLPPGAVSAVMETGEAIISGKPVDADALARAAVAGIATAACASNPYTIAVAWACGAVAGALYSPIKNGFARAFGRRTSEEIAAEKKANALKAEAEKYYWAAKTAHDRKLTALLAFIEEGLRLWGARVVGKGKDAKLWYADPLIVKQDPFRTPATGTSFQQKQLATQQLAFVNRFLTDVYSREFEWLRNGDIKLEEVLVNGKYDFRRAELYIKPSWRLLMVGQPPAWAVALRGQQLIDWAQSAKKVIDIERAKQGADGWPVCLNPLFPAVVPGRMTSPPYATGGCANAVFACRVNGTVTAPGFFSMSVPALECMPTGYGRTLHPPQNTLDSIRFPLAIPQVSFATGNGQQVGYRNLNAAEMAKLAANVSYGGTSPVMRNMRAAAVQAEQLQAVLAAGGDKLRFIGEAKARDLTSARVAGLAAEAKIQGEAAAKTGAALTAEQKARAEAEARAASSAATTRYLLAAAALAGAWYWYSSSKKKR